MHKQQASNFIIFNQNDKLQSDFFNKDKIKKELEKQYNLLDKNKTTPFAAAEALFNI